ncbi:hypothetical protein [Phenylobacterium sp.]|uniref:hypothetical protein n=1 Tax=Phenylobacterium sp. TaxID=1871053 RepID=UPI00260A8E47|nr:hypothetical protein [Phenylobacterium sp.]
MTTRAMLWLTVAVAASSLAGAALARGGGPGGGGGGAGGFGPPGGGGGHAGGVFGGGGGGFGHINNAPSIGMRSSTSTLDRNSHLDGALSNALAKSGVTVPGGDLKSACAGFRNLGGCVAALHVAQNLNLPGGFDALKARMTGGNAVSLGQAIQALLPSADARGEERKANRQADADLRHADDEVAGD